jgi:hypothetical protein
MPTCPQSRTAPQLRDLSVISFGREKQSNDLTDDRNISAGKLFTYVA